MNKVIHMESVGKIYNKKKQNEFEALKDISIDINEGEMVAIIGKSGAGKSTLLHIIACIDNFESGKYELAGVTINQMKEKEKAKIRNKSIGLIMQDYALIEEYTVEENVQIPLDFGNQKEKKKKVKEALQAVGLEELAKKKTNQLSGGQKQRVAIARAIVNNPDVVLADEPTGALDVKTSAEIMDLFCEINQRGKTIVIVTHDKDVADLCDRKIEISDGKIVSAETI